MLRSLVSGAPARRLRRLAAPGLLLAALLSSGVASAASPSDALTASTVGQTAIDYRELQPVATPSLIFIRWTVVPDCRGVTQTACENLLTNSGLQRGTLSFLAPATPPPYIGSVVVSQSPNPGVFVLRGSFVDLTLQPISPLGR